jgi:hypothetical protein
MTRAGDGLCRAHRIQGPLAGVFRRLTVQQLRSARTLAFDRAESFVYFAPLTFP